MSLLVLQLTVENVRNSFQDYRSLFSRVRCFGRPFCPFAIHLLDGLGVSSVRLVVSSRPCSKRKERVMNGDGYSGSR